MKSHSLHQARADFSKLFEQVLSGEPQRITRHGKESIVLVSETDWMAMPKTVPTLGSLLAQYGRARGFGDIQSERPFSQKRPLGSDFE